MIVAELAIDVLTTMTVEVELELELELELLAFAFLLGLDASIRRDDRLCGSHTVGPNGHKPEDQNELDEIAVRLSATSSFRGCCDSHLAIRTSLWNPFNVVPTTTKRLKLTAKAVTKASLFVLVTMTDKDHIGPRSIASIIARMQNAPMLFQMPRS